MSFNFGVLKQDVQANVINLVREWSLQQPDWGLNESSLNFDAINSLTVWDSIEDYVIAEEQSYTQGINVFNPDSPTNQTMPSTLSFQLPMSAIEEYSFNFGKERTPEPVYAIDGSDQVAYEFTRGRKGGAGIATYGWVATFEGQVIQKYPEHRQLQLVPADIVDLQNFSLINFNQSIGLSPESLKVRNYAALRRTQLEFLQLFNLIDVVKPGSIILLDGFLKANFTPPVRFIHEIGKKASQKGVIIIGVAKSSQIDMWRHFEEYWKLKNPQNCWIRPPATVLDKAYRSTLGVDTNQFLYLGENGRGIGVPIAATLSTYRESYYTFDFNCYDFEVGQRYLCIADLPEIHVKNLPLTTKDRDFISQTLAQIAYYADKVTCLGYPFPAALAHGLVKIKRYDVEKIYGIANQELIKRGIPLKDLNDFQEDPHKIVDAF